MISSNDPALEDSVGNQARHETTATTATVENSLDIQEFDPAREIQEGIPNKIRSCKSCVHAQVCKIFEVQTIHVQRLAELAKRSTVELDLTPPEEIGARCGAYSSGVAK